MQHTLTCSDIQYFSLDCIIIAKANLKRQLAVHEFVNNKDITRTKRYLRQLSYETNINNGQQKLENVYNVVKR